ncbi:MAG TPA: EamA family transporter [Bacillota bacterium]|nr:EamA family transporter [Bacillota bacterium]
MNRAYVFIILGAALWGTIGWYVKHLYDYGFTPMEVVTLRAWSAALMLIVYQGIVSRKELKLKNAKDIRYFIGTGIFSIIFFNFCMFKAIELSTLPVATALLYTAPAFVTIISYFIFKETLNRVKISALVITLIGTALVVGLIPFNVNAINYASILFGLGSGIGFALYTIFSKFAVEKYTSLTVTTYTFVVAAIALTPFFPYNEKGALLLEPNVLLFSIGLGFLPTAFAYIIYTYGLKQTEASKASILTTVEPVVATLIGIFVFQEMFSPLQMVGMAAIIGAVILIQLNDRIAKTKKLPL